jgi:hypothetical protein
LDVLLFSFGKPLERNLRTRDWWKVLPAILPMLFAMDPCHTMSLLPPAAAVESFLAPLLQQNTPHCTQTHEPLQLNH